MKIGSLFSGIGGLELGLEWAGLGHTVWQVEQSEFCRGVLARHWPDAERFEDVRAVGATILPPVDLICGGFPCQNISSAGLGEGLAGSRSGLWFEYSRIIQEMEPEWAVIENVASGSRHWVDAVTVELGRLGYESLSVPLSARDVGAPHIRNRVFVVARNANRDCKPVVSKHEEVGRMRGTTEPFSYWPKPPSISVADGFPDGMGAYGNAVVPQCAEVIGWMIREMSAEVFA